MAKLPQSYGYNDGYIHLADLRFEDLPDNISVKGYELQLKTEFHISLVCAKKIAAIIDEQRTEEIQAEIVNKFAEFVSKTPLYIYQPLKIFRFVQRGEKKTVIMMVEVLRLNEFFELLETNYKKKLPRQPTHITLYTLQPEAGIGILSDQQLKQDSEVVKIPELDSRF